MKFGISAFAWTSSFDNAHLDLLPRVRRYGYECLELPMFDPGALPVASLRRAFKANDLTCTVCVILPPGINPISPDAGVRRLSIAHLVQSVETAAELGATLIGGPLLAPIGYLPDHRATEDEWRWAVEALQTLTPLLERCEVTVSLEPVNRAETFFIRSASDALRLCLAVAHPNVGATVDTFHANIEEKNISSAIELLGPSLKHVHLSENDRGLLGEGHIDFDAVVRSLKKIGFGGFVVIEGFGFLKDESKAPGFLWADQRVSPDELALRGFSFLERLARR